MYMTINGTSVPIRGETTVLEVAKREGIWIPTLCHHPGLAPYGACRLCTVEVTAGGKPGLTASCTLPVMDGLVVLTDSPRVLEVRKMLVQLLLAGAPEAPAVRELAGRLGVNKALFPLVAAGDQFPGCILCGLCVRVCENIGVGAIGFAFRGSSRKVTPPFGKPAAACAGCQACANVCPTGAVKFRRSEGRLLGEPWQADLMMANCAPCGQPTVPEPLVEYANRKAGSPVGEHLCPSCRRHKAAEGMV